MALLVPRQIFPARELPGKGLCHKAHAGGRRRDLRGIWVVGFSEIFLKLIGLGITGNSSTGGLLCRSELGKTQISFSPLFLSFQTQARLGGASVRKEINRKCL